jgi:hypothetical protein
MPPLGRLQDGTFARLLFARFVFKSKASARPLFARFVFKSQSFRCPSASGLLLFARALRRRSGANSGAGREAAQRRMPGVKRSRTYLKIIGGG